MMNLLDILERKLTDLSPLVEPMEEAGYTVQAKKMRDAMTPSLPKQEPGGHGSIGHPVPSSSSIDPVGSPPPEPSTSKTEPSAMQLQPLDLNQFVGKDPHGDSPALQMDDLDGSGGTKEYTGKERIRSWTYEGNGRNLDKAMAIIHSNRLEPWHFYLSITDCDIHSATLNFPQIDSIELLYIYITCNLNQESGKELSRICISLQKSLPSLDRLHLDGYGSAVSGIGEIYQYFRPNSRNGAYSA